MIGHGNFFFFLKRFSARRLGVAREFSIGTPVARLWGSHESNALALDGYAKGIISSDTPFCTESENAISLTTSITEESENHGKWNPPHLPAHQAPLPIESASQLSLRLHNLALEHRELDDPLTVLRPDPREPDTLTPIPLRLFLALAMHVRVCSTGLLLPSINHHIGRVLVPPNMADEIDPNSPGSLVVQVAV